MTQANQTVFPVEHAAPFHIGLQKRELFAAISKPDIDGYSMDSLILLMGYGLPVINLEIFNGGLKWKHC